MAGVSDPERVPVALIAPLIREWQRLYAVEHEERSMFTQYIDSSLNNEGHLNVLAFHCGVSARVLRRIKAGKYEYGNRPGGTYELIDHMPFDMADKIVCATVGPMAWYHEPLSEFYGPLELKKWERELEKAAA